MASIRPEFQQIPRLAIQSIAQGGQGGEPDGLCLPRLQNGQVGSRYADFLGKLPGGHLPPGEHYIHINYYLHRIIPPAPVLPPPPSDPLSLPSGIPEAGVPPS